MSKSIPEIYGSLVFNDKIMRDKLPKDRLQGFYAKQSKIIPTWNWM